MPKRKTKNSTMREGSGTDGVRVEKMPKRKTKSSTTSERNWSELPEEILHLFSKKLPDISDFIRFRVVCKRWQLSAPVTDSPPQLPWLLERNEDPEENAIIRFYSLSSGKVHTITCPSSYDAWLQGPACRYLLVSHARSFQRHLLNPLTRDQIHVPFVNMIGFPNYIGLDPIEGGDIVVMSGIPNIFDNSNSPPNMMAFWRPKADNWVYVEGVGGTDNAFYMGQYYSNDAETGITNVIDIVTKKLAYQVAPPKDINPLLEGFTYIVESGGKILRLFQHFKAEPCHFDIHRLYLGDGKGKPPCWVKITDIGDQMLFLQYNGGLSFSASNFAGFKGNCIYFVKTTQYLRRYDIGDGTTELLPCPFDSLQSWFVPSLVKLSDINYA